jgi:putative hydrolase of the HAD superfamily
MPDRRYSAVTFDAMNTIIHADPPPPVIYAHHIGRYGPQVMAEDVAQAFGPAWAAMERKTPVGRDRYTSFPGGERAWWGGFVREILRRLDHPAPWQPLVRDLWQVFSEPDTWRVYPDARAALRRFAQDGMKLGLVSNWDRRLPGLLNRLALDELFGVVAISSLEGFEKPSIEIFRRALDRLGVAPAQAIHVGDNPREDYLGAEAAGMTPVLIDRSGRYADKPFRSIDNLELLADIVRQP